MCAYQHLIILIRGSIGVVLPQVWAVDLVLYKMHVGGGTVGEPWGNPSSWIQLFGFALLLLGTIMYAQVRD